MSLEVIGSGIWLANGEIVDFYGFPYPTRCIVVVLPNRGLWVWSPIALTPGLRSEINAIGQPAHLVSPNKLHHLYLQEWKAAWPDAKLWGPQSTISKRDDLAFEPALTDTPPEEWSGVINQAWFRGSCFLDEIVFFHQVSRTAIIADLSENFSEDFLRAHWSGWKRVIARIWGIVEGKGYAPLELRLSFPSKKAARVAKRKVLGWQPERVVMAHGEWQRTGGTRFLERSFRWIG